MFSLDKNLFDEEQYYEACENYLKRHSKDDIERVFRNNISPLNANLNLLFYSLGAYGKQMLEYNEYEPRIKYECLREWNDVTHCLGQDILTMSYIALNDYHNYLTTDFFAYPAMIRTNNLRLHKILDKGMAENHFHLKGSSQNLMLNWLSLMNYPENRESEFAFFNKSLGRNYEKIPFAKEILLAAVLRVFFFEKINEMQTDVNKVINYVRSFYNENIYFLNKWFFNEIDLIRNKVCNKPECKLDYALFGLSHLNDTSSQILAGERRLIYECFLRIFKDQFFDEEIRLFYLYLLIKTDFRKELNQINDRIGFRNFSEYEERKEIFIDNYPVYQDELYFLAISEVFNNENVVSLEARITPKITAKMDIQMVNRIDTVLRKHKHNDKINLDHVYYILHFIKRQDKLTLNEIDLKCRNYAVREDTKNKAIEIVKALESNSNFRKRIRGIDACNNENYCRPEVFGQAFRYLSSFNATTTYDLLAKEQIPIIIRKTYHVGEDFPDLLDGLRAIDEAILFCNLNRESRLGHAVALGLDVDRFYEKKSMIILTKQAYLDNIAWALGKIVEFNIDISSAFIEKMKRKFITEVDEVYDGLSAEPKDYYNSWQLRGDDPEAVKNPFEIEFESNPGEVNRFKRFMYNPRVSDSIRKSEYARDLFYAYHFDANARKEGEKLYYLEVNHDYIELVKAIQKKMQHYVGRLGIQVECNPSSNVLISQLDGYEQHPIFNLYDYDLKNSNPECPQLSVSINTDDQGIFDTSLENEFALIAQTLENKKLSNGEYAYSAVEVYKWIDSVRQMGIEQIMNSPSETQRKLQ